MTHSLKSEFLLNPDVVFLNHGSFGACPKAVFDTYQAWQRQLEWQPVEFIGRRSLRLLAEARGALAGYLGVADPNNLVYFPNPTTAVNMVARSLAAVGTQPISGRDALKLGPGDEILTTDHEYPAMDQTWGFIAERTGASYTHHPMPLPMTTPEAFVERFWSAVNPRTKVIFISHITCQTAVILPIEEIIRRARAAGILTIIDGAHAPSQIPLNLDALGADIYVGACHKWLCAPKGAAFLYARPEVQRLLDPLVISWGVGYEPVNGRSSLVAWQEPQGTRDPSAFLSVPAAIRFQAEHDWDAVRARCHALAVATRARIHALTGLEMIAPEEWFSQLVSIRLPDDTDLDALRRALWEDYRIEVPIGRWNGQAYVRVSFQAYNDESDADALVHALRKLL
ncbi:MAG: Isopenicillin N epimerase [Chloroflexi bacterium ADurb.Bin325]|nr:MAG: Isopenicillin N epimerase [Chloroflexi bacterium ADurb.Bin325]